MPSHAAESAEVRVRRADCQAMFNCQRGKVGIRYEVCLHTGSPEQLIHDFRMAIGCFRNPNAFTSEPRSNLPPRQGHRLGPFKHTRIGHQPHKCNETGPWQSNRHDVTQPLVKPFPRALVFR